MQPYMYEIQTPISNSNIKVIAETMSQRYLKTKVYTFAFGF